MDYVETLVVNKLKTILQKFDKKDEMINITKRKLQDQKQNNLYINKLEKYKTELLKLVLEVDNIYNDKLCGILSQDDFARIYERKKQEKIQLQNSINILESHLNNNIINEDELISNLIEKFRFNLTINRKILTDLVNKIEIDKDKKVYIYFNFKILDN